MERIKETAICIFTSIILTIPSFTFAEYSEYIGFSSEQNVKTDKEWTIKFNKLVDEKTVTSENIAVIDSNGAKVPTVLKLLSDGKSVSVKATSPYNYNSKYTIVLDGVKSTDQKNLKLPVKKRFSTQAPKNLTVIDSSEKVVENSLIENTISYNSDVTVKIPKETVDSGAIVSIKEVSGASLHEFNELKTNATYDISIGNSTSFSNKLTLKFKFNPEDLNSEYSAEEQLVLAYYDEQKKRWVESDFTIDEQNNEIVASTNHLTLWSIFGLEDNTVVSTHPNFKIYLNKEINAPRLDGKPSMDPIYDFSALVRSALVEARTKYSNIGIKVPDMTKVYIDDWGADKTAEWGWFSKNIEIPVSYSSLSELRHDSAHEYFHAVQNAYLSFPTMLLNRWWMEATADYAAAGIMGTGRFPSIDGSYLAKSMGTIDSVHEYQSSRFIDYLVKQKGVNFTKLWDYTVSAWSADMLGTIDFLLRAEYKTTLANCYKDFAEHLVFSTGSPAFSESSSSKTPYELSSQTEMPLSVKNLSKSINLSPYTAQIWAVKPEIAENSPSRSLILELGEDLPDGVYADVFVLNDNQWQTGKPVPDASISNTSESKIVNVKPGQIMFVMVSNGKSSSSTVSLNVKELDFAVSPSAVEGVRGELYDFEINASNIPKNKSNVLVEWDFGDAEIEDKSNLSNGSQMMDVVDGKIKLDISHKYMEFGDYNLEVNMYDSDKKLMAKTMANIKIPEEEISVSILPPRIITYELSQGATEVNHDFEAVATPEGNYVFYWDFGDGSQAQTTKGSSSAISHTYKGEGKYTPKVTLYGDDGSYIAEDQISISIENKTDQEVNIPDAGLNSAIRSVLKKPTGPIMKSDMETIIELNADWKNIKSLSGLEYAINLENLNIYFNQITDISPIANLKKLQYLYMSGNDNLVNISPVSGLVNLKHLYFNGNFNSVDISPVSGLVNLENLVLGQNKISNISSLNGLKKLKELHLPNNNISDLSPISGLYNLESLILRSNDIENLNPISGLSKLKSLELNDCVVSDISPLSNLTSLESLQMADNTIEDLTPIESLVNLDSLGLTRNYIREISPLLKLSKLKSLYLYENPLNAKAEEVINQLKARGCKVER